MVFVFGECELDVDRRELRRGGVLRALEPKAFTVLVHLLTQRHRAVSKDELLATGWPGESVSEAALTRCLNVIRQAVADDGVRQHIVKTLRGYGYRFVAAVAAPSTPRGLPPFPSHATPPRRTHELSLERVPSVVPAEPTPALAAATPPARSTEIPCRQCQTVNRAARQFCAACGQALWRPCLHCGFANRPSEHFCGGCGGAAAAAVPLTTRARLGPPLASTPAHLATQILARQQEVVGERKVATVLVASIEGVPALHQVGAPEEVDDLLNRGFAPLVAAVHQVEGFLIQITPHGGIALFGVPLACEDHVLRALHAAVGMQRAFAAFAAALHQTHGVVLSLRLGVHTGPVVVNAISPDGQRASTAAGATLACATGLQQLSRDGAIAVSAAVQQQAAGFFRFTSLGTHTLPELAEPVGVFICHGVSLVQSRLEGALARQHTAFQGRQQELALLQACWERVCRGQGQVVCLVGEAGIGKSRLAYECQPALGQASRLTVQALSYGQAMPYHAVLPLLRTLLGVVDTATPTQQRQAIHTHLTAIDTTLAADTPLLALLLGLPIPTEELPALPPEVQRRRLQHACLQVLLQQATDAPLCLLVEDGHWLDPSSQALLDLLVTALAWRPILLLCTARPGFRHTWTDCTYFHQVAIEPLAATETRALLRTLLQPHDASPGLHAWLHEHTGGNPFFIEELVRTLQTRGLLTVQGEVYEVTPAARWTVPDAIQSLIQARIDRLPAAEKHLVQVAAVLGPEVSWPVLSTLMEWAEDRLHRSLQYLQATEFLYATRPVPVPTYTFTHALMQEAAYGSLLPERRRALHARIVEAMEALTGDRGAKVASGRSPEQVEHLAHHALRGEVWDKAVTYCQQAGARAHDHAAFREAVVYFEQALQALAHLPEHSDTKVRAIEFRLAMVLPLTTMGENGRCLTLLGEAEALARALNDRVWLGRILAEMAMVRRLTADHDGAIAVGQQAVALAAELGDSALQVYASYRLGQAYKNSGDVGRAAELLRWSVKAADREPGMPGTDVRIQARGWLAQTLGVLGEFAEGRRYGEEALRLAMLEGRGVTPILAYGCLGLLYLHQGDLEHAIRVLEQGVALCRASGHRDWLRSIVAGLGAAYALQGRLTEGRALLEEGISEHILMGGLQGLAYWTTWLSEVCRLAGHGEEAWQHARQALDLARQQKERGSEVHALYQLGVVHAHADPPDAAQTAAHYQQALALAEELGWRPLVAHCQRGLGMLYAAIGQQEQARTVLSTAIALYRAMDMTFWLPQAEAALAQVEAR